MQHDSPVLLAILDGWGITEPGPANAPYLADTPCLDGLRKEFPHTQLIAHNGMVGLPEGQMGNSEVGHLNMGAGRVVYQEFTRINKAIKDGDLEKNPVLDNFFTNVAKKAAALHFCGLLSDGGVHSHISHLEALLQMAAQKGVQRIFIHCFMDGRDTPPESGRKYMQQLVDYLQKEHCGRVATICGRYWAMDRDKRWDRVAKAWQAMMDGIGQKESDPVAAIEHSYAKQVTDEFIEPVVLVDGKGTPIATMEDGDSVLFFNFRADRVRQLCHALIDENFSGFEVRRRPEFAQIVTLTEYEAEFPFPVVFPPVSLNHILGEEMSHLGLRQLRIAETEKYAHVTYFFNGGQEEPFAEEERILISSPQDVATYDLKPEMSAEAVTDALLSRLQEAEREGKSLDLVVLNFANGDMVGHTGVLEAAVRACATVDKCLARIWDYLKKRGWVMLITADHGNCEVMVDPETGGPHTAHTTNPVPFIVVGDRFKQASLRNDGALRDIAPTILHILNLPQPEEMDGESLL